MTDASSTPAKVPTVTPGGVTSSMHNHLLIAAYALMKPEVLRDAKLNEFASTPVRIHRILDGGKVVLSLGEKVHHSDPVRQPLAPHELVVDQKFSHAIIDYSALASITMSSAIKEFYSAKNFIPCLEELGLNVRNLVFPKIYTVHGMFNDHTIANMELVAKVHDAQLVVGFLIHPAIKPAVKNGRTAFRADVVFGMEQANGVVFLVLPNDYRFKITPETPFAFVIDRSINPAIMHFMALQFPQWASKLKYGWDLTSFSISCFRRAQAFGKPWCHLLSVEQSVNAQAGMFWSKSGSERRPISMDINALREISNVFSKEDVLASISFQNFRIVWRDLIDSASEYQGFLPTIQGIKLFDKASYFEDQTWRGNFFVRYATTHLVDQLKVAKLPAKELKNNVHFIEGVLLPSAQHGMFSTLQDVLKHALLKSDSEKKLESAVLHMRMINESRFVCDQCNTVNMLGMDILPYHAQKPKFSCSECNATFCSQLCKVNHVYDCVRCTPSQKKELLKEPVDFFDVGTNTDAVPVEEQNSTRASSKSWIDNLEDSARASIENERKACEKLALQDAEEKRSAQEKHDAELKAKREKLEAQEAELKKQEKEAEAKRRALLKAQREARANKVSTPTPVYARNTSSASSSKSAKPETPRNAAQKEAHDNRPREAISRDFEVRQRFEHELAVNQKEKTRLQAQRDALSRVQKREAEREQAAPKGPKLDDFLVPEPPIAEVVDANAIAAIDAASTPIVVGTAVKASGKKKKK